MGEATRAGFGQVAQGREGSRGEGRVLSTGAQRKHEAGLGSGGGPPVGRWLKRGVKGGGGGVGRGRGGGSRCRRLHRDKQPGPQSGFRRGSRSWANAGAPGASC